MKTGNPGKLKWSSKCHGIAVIDKIWISFTSRKGDRVSWSKRLLFEKKKIKKKEKDFN